MMLTAGSRQRCAAALARTGAPSRAASGPAPLGVRVRHNSALPPLLHATRAKMSSSSSAAAPAPAPAPPSDAAASPAAVGAASPSSASPLSSETRDGVLIVRVDVPGEKVNVLNRAVMEAFDASLTALERSAPAARPRAVVILSGKAEGFIAGADIKMLDSCSTAEELSALARAGQGLMSRLAGLGVPVVCGIHGTALGGGLELALACTYRVGTPQAKVGLPEVKLGLLPGAGGTQRLPRLAGIREALSLMTQGKTLKADRAYRAGLLDEIVEHAALERVCVQAARELAAGTLKPRAATRKRGLVHWLIEGNPLGRSIIWSQAAKAVEKAAGRHYPGPFSIIECVKAGVEQGEAAGLAKEAGEFGRLGMTSVSKSLRGIFFAETATRKNPFGKPAQGSEVKTLGVLGAGLMGAGIALIGASPGGMGVVVRDRSAAALRRGERQIEDALAARVKKRQITKADADAVSGRVAGVADADGAGDSWRRLLARADLVIEAVPEDLRIKHAVIAELESVLPKHAVFATNTSAIPIADIAKGASADMARRIVGMHFFSPADRMPLCEIIPHAGTAPEAAALALATAHRMGKTVIAVKDVPGFYVNRSLAPMLAEMVALGQAGIRPEVMDAAMKGFGMPVGPCTLADEVGLDTAYHVLETMIAALGPRMAGPNNAGIAAAVKAGYLGRKSGAGFYLYPPPPKDGLGGGKAKKDKGPRPVNTAMVEMQARDYAPPGRGYDRASIEALTKGPGANAALIDRLILRFVKECIHGLEDGVVRSPGDGDIGAVFGLGFPPYLGGPFRYVDLRGPANVLSAMQRLADTVGPQYDPPSSLVELAKAGGGKGYHSSAA